MLLRTYCSDSSHSDYQMNAVLTSTAYNMTKTEKLNSELWVYGHEKQQNDEINSQLLYDAIVLLFLFPVFLGRMLVQVYPAFVSCWHVLFLSHYCLLVRVARCVSNKFDLNLI